MDLGNATKVEPDHVEEPTFIRRKALLQTHPGFMPFTYFCCVLPPPTLGSRLLGDAEGPAQLERLATTHFYCPHRPEK